MRNTSRFFIPHSLIERKNGDEKKGRKVKGKK